VTEATVVPAREAWAGHLGEDVDPGALRARLVEGTLHGCFAATAARRPDALALDVDGERATHGELDARAARLAGWLRAEGVAPGDRVLLCGPTSLALVVAYVATLRAGAIAMPCDAALTADELAHVVGDGAPAAAFVAGDARERLRGVERVASLDEPLPAAEPLAPEQRPGPALLAYTSGTTGKPKGVPLTHANLLASTRGAALAWRWSEDDALVHALPLSHQHGLSGVHFTLVYGSRAHIARRFDPATLCATIERERATVLFAVPAMYERLDAWEGFGAADLSSLRLAVCGSAPLPAALSERVAGRLGQLPLERYGSTEAGLDVSNPLDGERRPGRVGRPLPGVELRLAGEDGEIQLRGPQVFEGYWRNDEATRDAFSADGWFRTGDLGRLDAADGTLEITGRSKELIISGGLNVYPREVEAVLEEHPEVARVAVAGVPSERWGEEVVAFVVADGELDAERLIAHCRERLSAFKCPKRVVALDELPVNRMGKVRRDALVAMAGD
jgi:malonyl-CoA/methylmalonyl-CoA synthetase